MDGFFTTGGAARQLRVSEQTVRNYCAAGVIKASRSPGGHFRIEPAEIERLKQLDALPAVPRSTLSSNGTRQAPPRNPNSLLAQPSDDAVQAAEESFISDRELTTDSNHLQRMRVHKEAMDHIRGRGETLLGRARRLCHVDRAGGAVCAESD